MTQSRNPLGIQTKELFDYEEVQDDQTLALLEKQNKEKSAALHTTGVLMALFAGALYGIQFEFHFIL